MRQKEQAHFWLSSANYEKSACSTFSSNFNFLFHLRFLKGLFIDVFMQLVTTAIKFSTGQFENPCYHCKVYPV